MERRQLFFMLIVAPVVLAFFERFRPAKRVHASGGKSLDEIQKNWKSLLAANAQVTLSTTPIEKSEKEWKEILSNAQFRVLREEDTERPFSSPLNKEKRPGVYVCAGCTLPLFTSEMKFESGTGWPSFFTHIPGHFGTKKDFKLLLPRTEYHCIRCKGHQGHVFDDGPPPTGQRWCNNGLALQFIPR